jgi:CRP/FNR family transcriptional regulator, cyclic AMP receptor protein
MATEVETVDQATVFRLLRTIRFFEPLTDGLVSKLVGIAEVVRTSANSILFSEGMRCEHLFFVIDGVIALDMNVTRRQPTRILTIGPGEVLAWSALTRDQPMTATATAVEESRLLRVEASDLQRLCEADHEIGYAFMRCLSVALSRRLLATRLQLLDLFAEPESN